MEDLGLTDLFGGSYRDRRVLVTGHTGFKGSWLSLWLDALGATVAGVGLASNTTPSHWDLIDLALDADRRVDIRDAAELTDSITAFAPDVIFHLAAQPLVRESFATPSARSRSTCAV